MTTFREWLKESFGDKRERLESAVREYLAKSPEAKRCYYVTRPKNINFDPKNPRHIEDELGPDYDRSLDVVPFKHHPLSFTCVSAAEGLAEFLRDKGFRARKVAGWYGKPEAGYMTGHSPSLYDTAPSPPTGFGRNAQQHWWVEVDGYVVDITSAQFHPTTPADQQSLVIRDKAEAMTDGSYSAVRRFPLGRAVRLPPNVTRMIDKIVSMKKFASKHSSNPNDNWELSEWIMKNGEKFSMSLARTQDIVAALKASTKPGFHFSDKRMMERTFGDAFDELEEDEDLKKQDENPEEFKVEKKEPRGTVRFRNKRMVLSSAYEDKIESNMDVLKSVIKSRFPEAEFGETERYSDHGYGSSVHYAAATFKNMESLDPRLESELKKNGFRVA